MARHSNVERELDELFDYFAKLVEKERKRKAKKEEKQDTGQKKDEGRYIKHDRG